MLACGEAGLRLGELVGLQVRDLDAAARTLRVERSVSPRGEVTAPKGGRVRTVALTERTAAALARLATADPGAPLLTGRNGGRLARCTAAYRLKRAQRAAGLPPVGPHGLRHTAASSALAGGADPVAVQKMLGHAQLATTVSTYLHDQGDGPRRAADALERARSSVRETDTDLTRAPQTRQSRVKRRSEKLSQGADLDGEI